MPQHPQEEGEGRKRDRQPRQGLLSLLWPRPLPGTLSRLPRPLSISWKDGGTASHAGLSASATGCAGSDVLWEGPWRYNSCWGGPWPAEGMLLGRATACRRHRHGHSVSDGTVVTPESLGRMAEGGNCVGKRSGPGDTQFLLRLFLRWPGEDEECLEGLKASKGSL